MEVKLPIRAFVINLDDRKDRFRSFLNRFHGFFKGDENIELVRFAGIDGNQLTPETLTRLDFASSETWVDPHFKRPLTKGEMGCFISHFRIWEWCVENNRPAVIFEDDVDFFRFDYDRLIQALATHDFAYLGRRPLGVDKDGSIPGLRKPGYSYWLCGYAITPEGARKLIDTHIRGEVIAADEYVPIMYGEHPDLELAKRFSAYDKLNACYFEDGDWVKPVDGAWDTSDTESGYNPSNPRTQQIVNGAKMNLKLLTVATDVTKANDLLVSALYHGFTKEDILVMGIGEEWRGGDITNGPGGGVKVRYLQVALENLDDNDIVLFLDGYDTFVAEKKKTVLSRFLGFGCDVLFSAEKTCWPQKELAPVFDGYNQQSAFPTEYKYLNSGMFIGKVAALKQMLTGVPVIDTDDDQLLFQNLFILAKSTGRSVELDRECYVFQNFAAAEDDLFINNNHQVVNKLTKCTTTVIHGNGGTLSKAVFNKFKELLYIRYNINPINPEFTPKVIGPVEYNRPEALIPVANEILQLTKFMTPEACQNLIALAEQKEFKSLSYDKFPGQEVRLKDIDPEMFDKLSTALEEKIYPIIEPYWFPLKVYGLRDAFVIKYEQGKQVKLDCHHDASLVSGIVKLNDDYKGGATTFYRQNYTTADIPVGDLVVWPGGVTHGHEGSLVTEGTKYALVIWTSRYQGDVL